eukprot:COSAG02_NODE_1018_length_15181_cov_18.026389_3_plen_75_part_00
MIMLILCIQALPERNDLSPFQSRSAHVPDTARRKNCASVVRNEGQAGLPIRMVLAERTNEEQADVLNTVLTQAV